MTHVMLGMPQLPPHPRLAGVGNLRGDETFPEAAPQEPDQCSVAAQSGQRGPGRSEANGRRWSAKSSTGKSSREAGPAAQGPHHGQPAGGTWSQLEQAVTARGGIVHWARDATEANTIVDST